MSRSGRLRVLRAGARLVVATGLAAVVTAACSSGGHAIPTVPETAGGVAHTWSDYRTAGGQPGAPVAASQTVAVSCRVQGFKVQDGNVWWYRLQAAPWKGRSYVSADAFYNNGRTSGSLHGTPLFDPKVPVCSS